MSQRIAIMQIAQCLVGRGDRADSRFRSSVRAVHRLAGGVSMNRSESH